jgi:FdhD protein
VRHVRVSGESPLTLKVDNQEVVTLMTVREHIPELLALGYLRNQRLIDDISLIKSVHVDWEKESVNVETHTGEGISPLAREVKQAHCDYWLRSRYRIQLHLRQDL